MAADNIRSIVCPSCNRIYKMPESKIPAKGATATCKNCGSRIVIQGGLAPAAATAPAPAPKPAPPSKTSQTPMPKPSPVPERASAAFDPALFQDYPELQELASPLLDYKEIFRPDRKGRYKSGLNKYKVKIVKSVRGLLEKVMNKDERVVRIGGGTAYFLAEIFFGNGWLTMLYNRYAIVATNQRALLVNTNNGMTRPTHYLFQVPYHNIKKVSRSSLFGHLSLKMKRGKSWTFTGMKRAFGKELNLFFNEKQKNASEPASAGGVLEYLCPSCYVPLGPSLTQCSKCGQEFKTAKKAMLRSLVLPGLGDFYLGHRFLGVLEMMVSLLIWALVILGLVVGDYSMILLLVIVNGMDAALTYHMAKKGYMPA